MPVSPAAFQQTVWNPVLDPTTLTRGGASSSGFDPNQEYAPDPGFDNPAIGTQTRCVVSGSALTATSNTSPNYTAPAAATLAPGTYRCVLNSPSGWSFATIFLGGVSSGNFVVATGTTTVDVVLSSVSNQLLNFTFNSAHNGKSITDLSVKRIGS